MKNYYSPRSQLLVKQTAGGSKREGRGDFPHGTAAGAVWKMIERESRRTALRA